MVILIVLLSSSRKCCSFSRKLMGSGRNWGLKMRIFRNYSYLVGFLVYELPVREVRSSGILLNHPCCASARYLLEKIFEKNKISHSLTAQPMISPDGPFIGKPLLCMQEASGNFGPHVERALLGLEEQCGNIRVVASKLGKMSSELTKIGYEMFLRHLFSAVATMFPISGPPQMLRRLHGVACSSYGGGFWSKLTLFKLTPIRVMVKFSS